MERVLLLLLLLGTDCHRDMRAASRRCAEALAARRSARDRRSTCGQG